MVNRRLGKPGRNITFRGSYNYTNSSSEQFSVSETDYYQKTEEERLEILNRKKITKTELQLSQEPEIWYINLKTGSTVCSAVESEESKNLEA